MVPQRGRQCACQIYLFYLDTGPQVLNVLQADATYKLLWLGNPVLNIGISDAKKVFHPLAIALCRQETQNDFAFIFKVILYY